MDFWEKSGEELIHKHPSESKKVFDSIRDEKFEGYIAHKRLAYIWNDTDKLFQKLIKRRVDNSISILEIGSFVGQGIKFFVKAFESIGITPHIDSIDLMYPYLEEGSDVNYGAQSYHLLRNTEKERMEHKVNLHSGRSRDILPYLNKEFDFSYVDGEHTSGGVFLDLVLTLNHSGKGSVILVDDMSWYDLKFVGTGVKVFIELFGEYLDEIYVKGGKNNVWGLFKITDWTEVKKYKVEQILFVVKKKTPVSLEVILDLIKKHRLHLNPVVNKGKGRTRRVKKLIK